MGIIQNAINQTIGTVGVAARLSPEYEQKQKEYEKKQSLKSLNKQAKTEMGAGETYLEDKTDLLEDIARIRPTNKNINAYMKSLDELNEEQRRVYANKKAAAAQEEKRAQIEQSKAFWDTFTEGGLYK